MSTIDRWDEVSTDEDVLTFKDPKQNAKFTLGVRMAIYQWEELNLAGGLVPSRWRREYVLGTVLFDLFDSLDAVPIDSIDEELWHSSSDGLDPEFDSDAGLVTGDLILKMYRECRERDFSRIGEMYRRFQDKQVAEQVKRHKAIEEDPKKDEAESGQTEHNVDESQQTEQNRDESEQTEQNRDEPEQTEHNDVGTNQDIDPKQALLEEDGFDLVTK